MDAFGRRGVPAHPVRPGELASLLHRDAPRRPSAALVRLPSGTPCAELDALLECVDGDRAGITWINPLPSVAGVHDKSTCLARLGRLGLPVPPTVRVARDAPASLDALPGERFVVKPPQGSAGRGVTAGLDRAAALASARAFADLAGAAVVQPLLGTGTDRRLLVVGHHVVAAMERQPAAGDGRGSVLYGARTVTWTPGAAQVDLALQVTGALELDVAGVDLVEHEGRHLILEVNSCPGLAAIEAVTGTDVAGAIVDLTIERQRRV